MFKKLLSFALVGVLSVSLVACSSPTPKEQVIEAYQIEQPKTYHSESSLELDFDMSSDVLNQPEAQLMISVLNEASLTAKSIVDTEKKQTETTLSINTKYNGLNIGIDLPVFVDDKNQVMYIETNGLIDALSTINPQLGSYPDIQNLKDKLIEFDLSQEQANSELVNYISSDEFYQFVKDKSIALLNEKSEEDFVETEDGKIKSTYSKEETKTLILSIVNKLKENGLSSDSGVPVSELEDAFEKLTFNDFSTTSVIEKGKLVSDTSVIDFSINDESGSFNVVLTFDTTYANNFVEKMTGSITLKGTDENNMSGEITIHFSTSYSHINEDVSFTINPESEEVVPFEELNMLFGY